MDLARWTSCPFYESLCIFIGPIKRFKWDSNHLGQIEDVSAALAILATCMTVWMVERGLKRAEAVCFVAQGAQEFRQMNK